MDAQPLKCAGGGVDAVLGAADNRADDIGELAGGLDTGFSAGADDGAGNGAGASLLAVLVDHVGEVAFVHGVDHVRRRRAARGVHAHIQRAVLAEGEAALRLVDLRGGYAQIQHDHVHRCQTQFAGHLLHV